jgi:hypothetical protein
MQWGEPSNPSNADTETIRVYSISWPAYPDNKWWMRFSLSHPPERRRLFVAGSVRGIIGGLELREPLHAGGMDFGYAVFERSALNLIIDLAIPQSAFKGDELAPSGGFWRTSRDSSRHRRDAIRSGFRSLLCRSSSFPELRC